MDSRIVMDYIYDNNATCTENGTETARLRIIRHRFSRRE